MLVRTTTMKMFAAFGSMSIISIMVFNSSAAWADIKVLSSSEPTIQMGSTIAESSELNIGEGADVLVEYQGETFTLRGPYKGNFKSYKDANSRCTFWSRIWGSCTTKPDNPIGGIRGLAPPGEEGTLGNRDVSPEPAPVGGVRGIR